MLVVYIIAAVAAVSVYLIFFAPQTATNQQLTTTTSSMTLPQPNPAWKSVVGYTQSFNTCKDICQQYQQGGCKIEVAKQFCNTVISIDLNRDGTIQSSRGFTPGSGAACENSLRCFDIITECKCSRSVLNVGTCMNSYLEQPITSDCGIPSA